MARYLMQQPGGYIYGWTPVQAKRLDMIEIDEEEAKKRLAVQVKGKKPKSVPAPVEEQPLLEPADVMPPEEGKVIMDDLEKGQDLDVPEAEAPPEDADPDIAFLENIRKVGKGKVHIEAFMRERYSIEVDRRLKLDQLVDQAVGVRRSELTKAEAA